MHTTHWIIPTVLFLTCKHLTLQECHIMELLGAPTQHQLLCTHRIKEDRHSRHLPQASTPLHLQGSNPTQQGCHIRGRQYHRQCIILILQPIRRTSLLFISQFLPLTYFLPQEPMFHLNGHTMHSFHLHMHQSHLTLSIFTPQ